MIKDTVQVMLRNAPPLLVFELRGALNVGAGDDLDHAYRAACDQSARYLLLHFAGVDHLDSAGIGIIIGLLTEARKAAQHLLITGLTPHHQKIFQRMGLVQYAPVFGSEEAARQWVTQQ